MFMKLRRRVDGLRGAPGGKDFFGSFLVIEKNE